MTNLSDSFLYNPDFHRFSDFLGLDKYKRENYETAQRILFLYKWGSEKSGSQEVSDIYNTVLKFKKELGTTFRGEPLIKELYRWIRLEDDGSKIKKEKDVHRERLSDEEKEVIERKERVAKKSAEWQDHKQTQKQISEDSASKANKRAGEISKAQASKSKLQSEGNIKVKEAIHKPVSEEIKVWE